MANLWEAIVILAGGSLLALRPPAASVGAIVAGAVIVAVTADLGTMTIVRGRLLDVRHVRGVALVLILGGALAQTTRLSTSPDPIVRVMIVATLCSALTGREAIWGWARGPQARWARQSRRAVRQHQAIMLEVRTLPEEWAEQVIVDVYPDVWPAVTDASFGLRNRLTEETI